MKPEEGRDCYSGYCLSTDVKETDIVFGAEKKLAQAIREAYAIFKPECISVFCTCPIGLIGDDIESVCRKAEEDLKIKVIPVRCEGYRGVSQSAGHHIASNALMEHLVGTEELENPGPFDVNVFGEYNIGGDYWVVKDLLERVGYRIVSPFTGDASFHDIAKAHRAKLNILLCHRSINYTNRMMEEKYGIPWLKVNYLGVEDTVKTLRDMAAFFDDPDLTKRTEAVIAEEMARVQPVIDMYRKRLAGKRVMILVGGSRAHHVRNMFETLGMDVVVAGYEFAHRDDYEGQKGPIQHRPHRTLQGPGGYPLRARPERRFALRRCRPPEEEGEDSEAHGLRGPAAPYERRPGHDRRLQPSRVRAAGKGSGSGSLLLGNQGQVRLPEDAHSLPPDALLRLQRPLHRL